MSTPRVLFVDHTAKLGGAELSLFSVVKALKDSGHVVLFEHGPFLNRLQDAEVSTSVLPAPSALDDVRRDGTVLGALWSIPALFMISWRFATIARDFDVVVANSQKSMLVAAIAGLIARRPVIWYLRDLLLPSHFGSLQRWIAARAARHLVSHVIANSKATKNALVDLGGAPNRISVVYNGIDPDPFEAVTDAEIEGVRRELDLPQRGVVGVFSRLAEWKGQHMLLEALRDLPDVTALLVGDALFPEDKHYVNRLRDDIKRWGLTDRVRMPGFRNDVPVLMKACDIVVHTSTSPEPFGRVVVEGMMANRPVIAAREGGPREIIDHETSGLLVSPESSSDLTMAIRRLMSHSYFCKRITHRGYHQANELYTVEHMVSSADKVFKRVAAAPDIPCALKDRKFSIVSSSVP